MGVSVLYREEAGYAVVLELSISSWDSVVTDGFFVLNVSDDTVDGPSVLAREDTVVTADI